MNPKIKKFLKETIILIFVMAFVCGVLYIANAYGQKTANSNAEKERIYHIRVDVNYTVHRFSNIKIDKEARVLYGDGENGIVIIPLDKVYKIEY